MTWSDVHHLIYRRFHESKLGEECLELLMIHGFVMIVLGCSVHGLWNTVDRRRARDVSMQ